MKRMPPDPQGQQTTKIFGDDITVTVGSSRSQRSSRSAERRNPDPNTYGIILPNKEKEAGKKREEKTEAITGTPEKAGNPSRPSLRPLSTGSFPCFVFSSDDPITPSTAKKIAAAMEAAGGTLKHVYNHVVRGAAVCGPDPSEIRRRMHALGPWSVEANKTYDLAYHQENLPDNFRVALSSNGSIFSSPILDRFFNAYVRNSYLIRKSNLFAWYRNAYAALESAYAGKGTTIYILDTCVVDVHPEVLHRLSVLGSSAISEYGSTTSFLGRHATAVSTVAAGTSTGLGKEAQVVLVPAFRGATGHLADILWALESIAEKSVPGKTVILLPFSGEPSSILDASLMYFYSRDVPVVAAAGNSSKSSCSFSPGRSKYALTVGALNSSLVPETWSNTGDCIDAFAPGTCTVGTHLRYNALSPAYTQEKGTSLSAAYVAGYLSQLLEQKRYTVSEIKYALAAQGIFRVPTPNGKSSLPVIPSDFRYGSAVLDTATVSLGFFIIICLILFYNRKKRSVSLAKYKRRSRT